MKRTRIGGHLVSKIKNILLRTSPPSLGRDTTLGLGTPGTSGVGHQTLRLGTSGNSGDTLELGTPGRLWDWALQGHSRVGYSRDRLGLGTPGMIEE